MAGGDYVIHKPSSEFRIAVDRGGAFCFDKLAIETAGRVVIARIPVLGRSASVLRTLMFSFSKAPPPI